MGDAKQAPPRQTIARTVASITREGRGSRPHSCDDPDLSAREFLLRVMRDTTLPLTTRIKAASAVAPYFTDPAPVPPIACRIIIEGIPPEYLSMRQGSSPRTLDHEFVAEDPEQTNGNSQSKSVRRSNSHPAQSETPAPVNLTRYSDPPSLAEIEEIKAAINKLRPDLTHLPTPDLHLCACGHWLTFPCACIPTKHRMN